MTNPVSGDALTALVAKWRLDAEDGLEDSDTLIACADELAALLAAGRREVTIPAEPDNHHNALLCAYCNPQGLKFAAGRSAATTEPDYVTVLKQAKAIVNASPLHQRFINHTPLENDIAVWMADFAFDVLQQSAPAPLPAPTAKEPTHD